jgi:hypothetical protein
MMMSNNSFQKLFSSSFPILAAQIPQRGSKLHEEFVALNYNSD